MARVAEVISRILRREQRWRLKTHHAHCPHALQRALPSKRMALVKRDLASKKGTRWRMRDLQLSLSSASTTSSHCRKLEPAGALGMDAEAMRRENHMRFARFARLDLHHRHR